MLLKRNIFLLGLVVSLFSGCSQSPQAYLEKGKKAFEQKNYEVAILYFKNAMQKQPKEAEPYYQIGLAYLASGDVGTAAAYLRKASELNPRHTGAQLKLAELMAAGRNKEMVEEAQKRTQDVLNLIPDDTEALNLLALTELRLGNRRARKRTSSRCFASPRATCNRRLLWPSPGWPAGMSGAEEALKQAVAQAPKSAGPMVYLGGFYLGQGKTAEAEEQFRHALEIDPKHGPALFALGAMQVRAGHHDRRNRPTDSFLALPDKQL